MFGWGKQVWLWGSDEYSGEYLMVQYLNLMCMWTYLLTSIYIGDEWYGMVESKKKKKRRQRSTFLLFISICTYFYLTWMEKVKRKLGMPVYNVMS